jgi:hypothetical protein
MGTPVSQDARGEALGRVRDAGLPRSDSSVRLYETNLRQDFDIDGAELGSPEYRRSHVWAVCAPQVERRG